MSKKDQKFMGYLEKIAIGINAETINRARLAACLVYKNDIISVGVNALKSHPFQARFGRNIDSIYLHAETNCIKNALKVTDMDTIAKSKMYIHRVKYDGSGRNKKFISGLAKPCDGCARAIATFNIKNVMFSCDDGSYSCL